MERLFPLRLSQQGLSQSELLRAEALADPPASPQPASVSCARRPEPLCASSDSRPTSLDAATSPKSIVYMRAGCGKSARPVRRGARDFLPGLLYRCRIRPISDFFFFPSANPSQKPPTYSLDPHHPGWNNGASPRWRPAAPTAFVLVLRPLRRRRHGKNHATQCSEGCCSG